MDQQYDSLYLEYQKKKQISFFIQILFVVIGALLIGSFAIFFSKSPQKADALISPVTIKNQQNKPESDFSLLYANKSIFIYKEAKDNIQTINLVNRSTNLTTEIISAKRVGFGGFINSNSFYVFEDNDGFGKFTVYTYNMQDKSKTPFIAFFGPKEVSDSELNKLISVSPDKTKIAINHKTGIVLYTLKTSKEITILENNTNQECTNPENKCIEYKKPSWISNNQILVYENNKGLQTPLITNQNGSISSILDVNSNNLAVSPNGKSFITLTSEGLMLIESNTVTNILPSSQDISYLEAMWIDENNIALLTTFSNLPTIIKTDKEGKKVVALKEFLNPTQISDLQVDSNTGSIYFVSQTNTSNTLNTQFFKFEENDEKPISFYTINRKI